jgi:hypothetical protein
VCNYIAYSKIFSRDWERKGARRRHRWKPEWEITGGGSG